MGIGVAHAFGRLLGGGIDGELGVGLLRLGEGHLGIGAVDRTGRGHQKMTHRVAPRGLHNVEGADDIGIEIGARILEAVAHAGLGGQMHDLVGDKGVDRRIECRLILEPRLGRRELRVPVQHVVAAALERHVVIIGHPVIAVHDHALVEQQLREVISDEAGGAGDEDAPGHDDRLPMIDSRN
jgi:hypothetical protein